MRFAAVSSPGFPQPYSDNQDCTISVDAPRGYQIEVEFEELMLENESTYVHHIAFLTSCTES